VAGDCPLDRVQNKYHPRKGHD